MTSSVDYMADGGETAEAYAEGTPLDNIFPESPNARVLETLLNEHNRTLNKADLEHLSGVDGAAEHAENLAEEYDLVEIENGQYRINKDSKAAKYLGRFTEVITDQELGL